MFNELPQRLFKSQLEPESLGLSCLSIIMSMVMIIKYGVPQQIHDLLNYIMVNIARMSYVAYVELKGCRVALILELFL